MAMSDEDRQKLAKEIVKQFFLKIDESIGHSVRKKLVYVMVAMILAGGVSLGIVKIPGLIQ